MKEYAQAILQFTGYPLEPIVALAINKSYQTQAMALFGAALSLPSPFSNATTSVVAMDEIWYNQYE